MSRTNYEMYGHPDGKQEFSQGIALPAWVVESQNTWWVMGVYALVLGVALPFLVVSFPFSPDLLRLWKLTILLNLGSMVVWYS